MQMSLNFHAIIHTYMGTTHTKAKENEEKNYLCAMKLFLLKEVNFSVFLLILKSF